MAPSRIIEVVENPLAVPFPEYITVFQLTLLPTLLREEGVISVRTGVTRGTTSTSTHAVSLTEWNSMESHTKFMQKPTTVPFFTESAKLTTGPPKIDHYTFENLSIIDTNSYTQLKFSSKKTSPFCAQSLDDASTFCEISLVAKESLGDVEAGAGKGERMLVVEWFSFEKKYLAAHL